MCGGCTAPKYPLVSLFKKYFSAKPTGSHRTLNGTQPVLILNVSAVSTTRGPDNATPRDCAFCRRYTTGAPRSGTVCILSRLFGFIFISGFSVGFVSAFSFSFASVWPSESRDPLLFGSCRRLQRIASPRRNDVRPAGRVCIARSQFANLSDAPCGPRPPERADLKLEL